MKKTTPFLFLFFSYTFSFGQSAQTVIKYPVKGKQVVIDAQEASLTVEGYTGNELIIEPYTPNIPATLSPDAAGLSLITSTIEKEDNIIHFDVVKNDPDLFSIHLTKSNCRHLHIKVPQNTHLKMSFAIGSPDAKVSFTNLAGELEIEGASPVIEFTNITGPIILSPGKSGHGIGVSQKVIVSHLHLQKNNTATSKDSPLLNIITTYADIDISIPENLKATIQADLPYYGNLFSDFNIIPKKTNDPPIKNRYLGELNGGGKMIIINSLFGNVFIRKQK